MPRALPHLVILLCFSSGLHAEQESVARRTVVKVFSKSNRLDLSSPWKRGGGGESSGSGVWIGGRRILTNDHLVDYATQISVQLNESAERLPADVVFSSPEMDLAIVELDEVPFDDVEPPTFADRLPELRSKVLVYGFPEGGSSLSVTEGIVSRIEYRGYAHGARGLRVQVDAAINPGNSGGPAYVDGQVIGLAFQKRARSDNIGYLIPSEELLRFLRHAEEGVMRLKPELPIVFQRLLNRGLRTRLGLDRDTTGVWVRSLIDTENDYPIKVGDIVTHIGEHNIDNSGQCRLIDNVLVNFEYFVADLAEEGTVPLVVLRDGEELTVDAPVRQPLTKLLQPLKGTYPDYFVYGPFVFIAAPSDFLRALESMLGNSDTRRRVSGLAGMATLARRESPLITRRFDLPNGDEELVLVVNWLPHRIAIGYGSPNMQVVKSINGARIRNLEHLVETLRDQSDEYLEIDFVDKNVEKLVFERQKILDATEDILQNNGIPRQGSRNLLKIWENQ